MTNGIGFLPQCDQIVVLDEGQISEIGTYKELIDNGRAFAEFIRTFTNVQEDEEGVPGNYSAQYSHNQILVVILCLLMYILVLSL